MENKRNIVVVGSCMIDFLSYAPRLPQAGETILGKKFVTGFGGKGANQCVAAAKLGASTSLIARLGDDIWGQKYLESLSNDNVDVSSTKITPCCTSGIAQIVVSDKGENQIVIVQGANEFLSVEDINNVSEKISTASVVICQLETAVDIAIKTLELCKGVSILNGAPAISNCNPLLFTLPSIFCVNETEASIFTGLSVNSISEAKIALQCLRDKGCKTVIITMGSQGALILAENVTEPIQISSPSVKCIDSTGAGDSFIGSLAYLLANKAHIDLDVVVKVACAIAADSVTKPGTQTSFPNHDILQRFVSEF